jgi:hypothetical protein
LGHREGEKKRVGKKVFLKTTSTSSAARPGEGEKEQRRLKWHCFVLFLFFLKKKK